MTPFHGCGSTASRLQIHYKKAVYFLPLTYKKLFGTHLIDFLRMKDQVVVKVSFEYRTLGLGIQCLNHQAIYL